MNLATLAQRTSVSSQALFLLLMPSVKRHAQHAFRRLRQLEQEEAVQEVLAQVFIACVQLAAQGQQSKAYPSAMARFAIARYRDGRRAGQPTRSRDLLSEARWRRQGRCLNRPVQQREGWQSAVADDSRTPILDQVCFRMDFPVWLSSLSERQRGIAHTLSMGNTAEETARKHQITPARVSQLRQELRESWLKFEGDLAPTVAANAISR